jgi:hypothetical protein
MIVGSYNFQFNSNVKYYLFCRIKDLNKFFILQIGLLNILIRLFNEPKFRALRDYILLLKYDSYMPDIKQYANVSLAQLNKNEYLDVYDLCGQIYPAFNKNSLPSSQIYAAPEFITYAVEKSGFFSTIFTLICISFYCGRNNIKLHIDWDEWPYTFDAGILFDDEKNVYFEIVSKGQSDLFFKSREYLDQLTSDSKELEKFLLYRYKVIKNLHDWCGEHLNNDLLVEISSYKTHAACFIRRGDKLLKEAYPININIYKNILSKYSDVVILGDDYYFNKKLAGAENFDVFEIPGYKPQGAYLNNTGENAVQSILCNFYLLSESKFAIGDPYCNLVAAALVYRKETFSYDKRLHPWQLRTYI